MRSAQRLATLGRYDLEIDRVSYPPRYPPWMSLLMAPLYWIRPDELGMGILLVLAFAAGAALCAYEIARRLSNEVGGAVAAILLIHNGVFAWDARQIVPDIPALALALVCGLMYLRAARSDVSWRPFLFAGLCGGLAGAMRNLSYLALVPMLVLAVRPHPQRVRRLVALSLPPVCFLIASLIYNRIRFGGFLRDGYQYWAPIPHQFFNLLFSTGYLSANLAAIAPLWWLLLGGAAGLLILWRIRRDLARKIALFIALAAAPISLIHLFYFWGDPRFHLLLIATLFITMGAGFGLIFASSLRGQEWLLLVLMIASAFIPVYPPTPEPERRKLPISWPPKRPRMRSSLPPSTRFISSPSSCAARTGESFRSAATWNMPRRWSRLASWGRSTPRPPVRSPRGFRRCSRRAREMSFRSRPTKTRINCSRGHAGSAGLHRTAAIS